MTSLKEQTQAAADKFSTEYASVWSHDFRVQTGHAGELAANNSYLEAAYNSPTILRAIEAMNEIKNLSNDKCAIQLAHVALKEIQEAREGLK